MEIISKSYLSLSNWQRRQNSNNNFSATVPYDMEQQNKEMKEFLDDLTTRDRRMMFAVITFVHTADSKEQLDNDTEALLTTARKHRCQFGVLKFQQVDGLSDHTGIVQKVENGRVYTVEGNSDDSVRQNSYPVGYYEILGYGVPQY